MVLLLCSFDVGEHVALVNFRALAGCHLNKLSAESGRYRDKLAPGSLYVAEGITLGVLFSDVGLYRSHSLSVAAELPEHLSLHGCNDGIGLGVLEGSKLFWR